MAAADAKEAEEIELPVVDGGQSDKTIPFVGSGKRKEILEPLLKSIKENSEQIKKVLENFTEKETNEDAQSDEKGDEVQRARDGRVNAWFTCDFRLDEITNKDQTFTITGWVNVTWKEPNGTDLSRAIKQYKESDENNVWSFDDDISIRILDLCEADKISYYLPIDARRIFFQPSIKAIEHKDPPYLIFNTKTRMARTEYHVTATLSEHMELFWFPFDKQFLNIKVRWNKIFYHALDWVNDDREIPMRDKWFGDEEKNAAACKRALEAFYNDPLKIHVVEDLDSDIRMIEPWVDLRHVEEKVSDSPLRFVLIRLRFIRDPTYYASYILFPFFVIVLCGFSVYAVPKDDVADRLSVSVTVLLTFAAFQSIISEELPTSCDMESIDLYVMLAYGIQLLIIFGVTMASLGQYDHTMNAIDEDVAALIDIVFGCFLFVVWMVCSMWYCIGGIIRIRANDDDFWYERSKKEVEVWRKKMECSREMKNEHKRFNYQRDDYKLQSSEKNK